MLAARDLPEGPVVKQLLEWIAELENQQSNKKMTSSAESHTTTGFHSDSAHKRTSGCTSGECLESYPSSQWRAGGSAESRTVFLGNSQTCSVDITHTQSKLLTNGTQFFARF
jgi:hypothetical protein